MNVSRPSSPSSHSPSSISPSHRRATSRVSPFCRARRFSLATVLALCFFIINYNATPAYALVFDGPAIMLSHYAPTPALSNMLAEAEMHARQHQFRAAADSLSAVLSSSAENRDLLAETYTRQGPLDMLIDAVRLGYVGSAERYRNPLVQEECYAALSNHAARAKGQKYYAYKMIFHRLIDYYHGIDHSSGLFTTNEELIAYDLDDHQRVLFHMHCLISRNAPRDQIIDAWLRYAAYVPDSAEKLYYEAQIATLRGRSPMPYFTRLMSTYTPRNVDELSLWLSQGREALRADDEEIVRAYLTALGTAALRLPTDDSAIEMVALLLAERHKIEMITAALTNAPPRSAP